MPNEKKLIPEEYNKFVNSVKINLINLKQLSVERVNYDAVNSKLSVKLSFNTDTYKSELGLLRVYPKFIIEVVDINDVTAFSINFEYSIEYSFNGIENIENDYIEAFVKRNVPINIWPYARELVSSLTTRMGFPALIMAPFTINS
ncbi:MAG: protein-export chaperone SecB [Sedimentibacter sp.]